MKKQDCTETISFFERKNKIVQKHWYFLNEKQDCTKTRDIIY